MFKNQYRDEGYSALDIPTSTALAYVREHAPVVPRDRHDSDAKSDMAPGTLLVVDAACDMPADWLRRRHIAVLPMLIQFGNEQLHDTRDDRVAGELLRRITAPRAAMARSRSLPPEEIRDHLQSWMAPSVDAVVQITLSGNQSKLYLSALSATQWLMVVHNKVRRAIGNRTPFRTWVIDSQTALTGLSVLLAHAVRLRDRGISASDIAVQIQQYRRYVHTLIVPDDVSVMHRRARQRGGRALTRAQYWAARLFNLKPLIYAGAGLMQSVNRIRGHQAAVDHALRLAITHAMRGLLTPTICVSYAGSIDNLRALPSFQSLQAFCERTRIELIASRMSLSGSINLGANALSISFASERFSLS